MPSDSELLARWREGDAAAGNELAGRYFDSLYGFFRNKVGDDIDDLLQQTLLGCVEASRRFEGRSSFRTYLFGIARNVLLGHIKARRRLDAIDPAEQSAEDLGTTPSRNVARSQESLLLLRALRRIPIDYQIALELYYWEGMNTVEIAEVQDIPTSTARTRLRRAREAVERELAQLVEDPRALRTTLDDLERWARSLRGG